MVRRPFRGLRLFRKDKRVIAVLLGIAEEQPDRQMRLKLREAVNSTINQALIESGANIKVNRETVNLTTEENPSASQKAKIGQNAKHLQQYSIQTELEEVPKSLVTVVYNTVVSEVNEYYNITGSETIIR